MHRSGDPHQLDFPWKMGPLQTVGRGPRRVATKNPQRIELGQTLEGLRRRAGASASDVEERLGWHAGKCRKVETGERTVSKAEVDVLADQFGATPDERAALHLMADAARRRESATHVADFAQSYVALERQAAEIDFYDAELITALAVTEGYARAQLTDRHGSG
jgi:hypothetical protein